MNYEMRFVLSPVESTGGFLGGGGGGGCHVTLSYKITAVFFCWMFEGVGAEVEGNVSFGFLEKLLMRGKEEWGVDQT